ncbi:MAG: adenylate/guanylate cyclase domain-containing protein [Bacteroidia bacterium]
MDTLLVIAALSILALVVVLIIFISKNRRMNELKVKTAFAAKSEELVKVEMAGSDTAATIAQNFNVLGEKLSKYKGSNTELSSIKMEKQSLDSKLKTFEDSLSQLNLLTEIGQQITSCLNVNDIALKLFKNINASMIAEEVSLLINESDDKKYYNVFNGKLEQIKEGPWCDDKNTVLNWSYDNNKEVFLNNASVDYGQYVFKPITMQTGIAAESAIAIPLSLNKKMIGSVSVLCQAKDSFSDFHLDFARSLASYVSVAIDNAYLYSELDEEKQKSEDLLLNILPPEIAHELKQKGKSEARQFEHVTVLFTDFVNFTGISETLSPKELVSEIDLCFKTFDDIIEKHGLEKIKTIGDAYLAVCGMPEEDSKHAINTAQAALDIRKFIIKRKSEGGKFEIRIGMHSGPLVAGIVGVKKFAYDIWGDTVNTAARMEQKSEPGKINISGATYELIKNHFTCTHRGKIEAKNKGMIDMYFVE